MEIVRAGWVQRLSTLFRKWKRTWLVLYQNGHLAFFESPDRNQPDEIKILPGRLNSLFRSGQIENPPLPPFGKSREFFIQLVANDGEEISFICGESADDAFQWHVALDKRRGVNPTAASPNWRPASSSPYATSPSQLYYGPGTTHGMGATSQFPDERLPARSAIVEQRNPHYFSNRYQFSSYYPPRSWMLGKRDGRFF